MPKTGSGHPSTFASNEYRDKGEHTIACVSSSVVNNSRCDQMIWVSYALIYLTHSYCFDHLLWASVQLDWHLMHSFSTALGLSVCIPLSELSCAVLS